MSTWVAVVHKERSERRRLDECDGSETVVAFTIKEMCRMWPCPFDSLFEKILGYGEAK